MEDNKLIAEFMGYKNPSNAADIWYHYDTSWDWLMPVIQKINVVTKYDDYHQNRLHIQRVLDDCINENAVGTEEVYKAVVEFIKNQNK